MKVAIMYSGGKDSTFAIDHAKEKGWDIRYLVSVKPTRTDCFLFHFATVEHTPKLAEMLGLRHILTSCDVADPKQEANIIKEILMKEQESDPIEALVLGGTGLQETQIRSLKEAMLEIGVEVFAAHEGQDHDEVMRQMRAKGYTYVITQIASDGLNKDWLGMEVNDQTLPKLFDQSVKYGFHVGGEGGYFDTLVLEGPIFPKKLMLKNVEKVMESECAGHVVAETVVEAKTEDLESPLN